MSQTQAIAPIRVLLVEDHAGDAELVQELLSEGELNNFYLTHVGAMKHAIAKVKGSHFDVVLLDLSLPDSSGLDTVAAIVAAAPSVPVVILSGLAQEDVALHAVSLGAQDYLIKGQVDGKSLGRTILFAIQRKGLGERDSADAASRKRVAPPSIPLEAHGVEKSLIVGRSAAIQEIRRVIRKVGPADATVLITGETGTGKELVAEALHEASSRRKSLLVAVNCGSIPETLLESMLFGHAKGAFTGADKDKRGLFEVAKDGTLFLDEIGELPLSLQPKLLRALEKHEILPVGSTTPVAVSPRVMAATNRDLQEMIQKELFRSDLFYRLNVVEIGIPPLRERVEDIPEIADALLRRLCRKMQRPMPELEKGVYPRLACCAWPGNVRELSNVLERLLLLTEENCIRTADIDKMNMGRKPPPTDDLKAARSQFEQEHIRAVMERCGGNKERAAQLLNIDLSSLYRKLSE